MTEKKSEDLTLEEAQAVLAAHGESKANYVRKIVAVYDHKDPKLITTLLLDEESPTTG